MRIKIMRPTVLFVIIVMVFSSGAAIIQAQQPPPGGQPPPILNLGQLPVKTLLASEPLRLQLNGPFDLSYEASVPQTISIYVRSLPENPTPLDTTLEIDDAKGQQIAFNDDFTSDSRDAGVEDVSLPAAGIYTIHLGTFDLLQGGGVEVQLVTSAPPDVNTQGGDTILDVTGKLDGKGPATFTFSGTTGQVVTISAQAVNPPSPDMDLSITLYDPDGTVIGSDDDSGATIDLGDRDPALIHFSLPATGEYKVEVSSWFDTPGDIAVKIVPG